MRRTMAMGLCAAALWAAPGFAEGLRVLCTTFPVYQIARNVAEGRVGTVVDLLLPAGMGCPHNYALTPADMRKLARADVLLANGLGLEEFLGAPTARANRKLRVVEVAAGIGDLIALEGDGHGHDCGEHGHEHHGHGGWNPHLFASPRMSAKLALNVAGELSKLDPGGAGTYFGNAAAYGARMEALAGEWAALGRELGGVRIVQPHGAFDYLARDGGMEIVATLQAHGVEPSAAEMVGIVRAARAAGVRAVLVEPQYSPKAGRAVAKELGVPVVEIDPGASGPADAPLDYFDRVVRGNAQALRGALGAVPD